LEKPALKALHEKALHEKALHEKALHEKALHEKASVCFNMISQSILLGWVKDEDEVSALAIEISGIEHPV